MPYSHHNRADGVDAALRFLYSDPIGYHQGALLAGLPPLTPAKRRLVVKEKDRVRERLAEIVHGGKSKAR